jgi:hypothetical protein
MREVEEILEDDLDLDEKYDNMSVVSLESLKSVEWTNKYSKFDKTSGREVVELLDSEEAHR